MSIKAKKLKSSLLKSGKKVGILVAEDSKVDRAITGGAEVTATIINDGEKQAKRLVKGARAKLDELRAKIHEATAPRAGKK
jgi:hypothetical protein